WGWTDFGFSVRRSAQTRAGALQGRTHLPGFCVQQLGLSAAQRDRVLPRCACCTSRVHDSRRVSAWHSGPAILEKVTPTVFTTHWPKVPTEGPSLRPDRG